jgi:Flp pilus assembly protein TadD
LKPLEPPDSFHVLAAQGWFELGNHREAISELEQVTPKNRGHPEVLRMRWAVHVAARHWALAIKVARRLTAIVPGEPGWWGALANALYSAGRTQEARDTLEPTLARFPSDPGLRYNMACYECQLGRFAEAKTWLQAAFALDRELRQNALTDPDLKPMWEQIEDL